MKAPVFFSSQKGTKMKNVLMLLMVLSIALAGQAAFAQDIQTRGSIGGTVTDQNGGALPNATVTVTGLLVATSGRTAMTDSNGVFKVDNLNPGLYDVKVSNAGF